MTRGSRIRCRFVYYIVCLHFVNINKQNRKNGFSRLSEVQLFRNLMDAFTSTQWATLRSYFWESIICLYFTDVNKCRRFVYIWKMTAKCIEMDIKWKISTWGLRISCLLLKKRNSVIIRSPFREGERVTYARSIGFWSQLGENWEL